MEKYYFDIYILPVFMKKVFEEMRDRFIGDVAAHDDMPVVFVIEILDSVSKGINA